MPSEQVMRESVIMKVKNMDLRKVFFYIYITDVNYEYLWFSTQAREFFVIVTVFQWDQNMEFSFKREVAAAAREYCAQVRCYPNQSRWMFCLFLFVGHKWYPKWITENNCIQNYSMFNRLKAPTCKTRWGIKGSLIFLLQTCTYLACWRGSVDSFFFNPLWWAWALGCMIWPSLLKSQFQLPGDLLCWKNLKIYWLE